MALFLGINSAVAFSPDSSNLAQTSTTYAFYGSVQGGGYEPATGSLSIWNLPGGFLQTSLITGQGLGGNNGPSNIGGLGGGTPCLSPSGTLVAGGSLVDTYTATGGSKVYLPLWNSTDGTLTKALSTQADYGTFSNTFSPDGAYLAIAGTKSGSNAQGVLEVWNVAAGTLAASFKTSVVLWGDVAFSADGSRLAIAGDSGLGYYLIELWNVSTGQLLAHVRSTANNGLVSLAFSPDGSLLALGGSYVANVYANPTGVLEVWNLGTGKLAELATGESVVNSVSFSPDNWALAVGGQTETTSVPANVGTVEVWIASSLTLGGDEPLLAGSVPVSTVRYSNDGTRLYALSAGIGGIQVFDTSNDALSGDFDSTTLTYVGQNYVAISSDFRSVLETDTFGALWFGTLPPLVSIPIQGFSFSPASAPGFSTVTGTITLSKVAPSGGATIGLQTSSLISLPTTVTIPAGKNVGTFTLRLPGVSTTTTVTIVASSGPYSKSANLTITTPNLVSITINPSSVTGGASATGSFTLSSASNGSGAAISLSSNNPAVVVPANVFVNSGATSGVFTITTSKVTTKQVATITAIGGSVTKQVTLTVNP